MAAAWESAPLIESAGAPKKSAWESAPLVNDVTPEKVPDDSGSILETVGRVAKMANPASAALSFVTDPEARKDAANLGGGIVRGAGSIGSTLLYPIDKITDAVKGDRDPTITGLVTGKQPLSRNEERRRSIDDGLKSLIDADPNSVLYQAGKLGGEIAGTAGVGNFLVGGLKAAPIVAKYAPRLAFGGLADTAIATKAPALLNAIQTGGMRAGASSAPFFSMAGAKNMLTRATGGAITGGTTAGLVDPEYAATGAIAGAALPPGLKIAGEVGRLVRKGVATAGKNILGASTGTGAESIDAAYQAGRRGSQAFLDNMRGKASFGDVVDDAKTALQKMRTDRSEAYRSGMVDISNDKTVIDFAPISSAMSKVSQMGSYKGQQINKNAAGTVDEIAEVVNKWRSLDPAEFHTPEGLDALKQAVGDIRDSTQFGTAARRAADSVYNSIKDQITAQAPTYSKVMKDYAQASSTLKEVEKALSLGDKASVDTSIRKLQSLLRNNAQTNYGNRLELARTLEDKGGADLMSSIAGQTMNSLTPRGMTGAIQKGGAVVGAVGTGGASIPLTLAAAPFTSPRLVGEALYGIGRASGAAGSTINRIAQGSSLLSAQSPVLIEARNALYRTAPIMAIPANQATQR